MLNASLNFTNNTFPSPTSIEEILDQSLFLNPHTQITPTFPWDWSKIFTNWAKKCSVGYIFSIWYKLIHFSLPLSPALNRMGNIPNALCHRCNEAEESHPHFIFHCKLSQTIH